MNHYSDVDLRDSVQKTADKYAEIANKRLGTTIPIPVPIDWNLCLTEPKCAGKAYGSMSLSINFVLLQDYPTEIINDTTPHEIGHLVQFQKFDFNGVKSKSHGWEWKEIMRLLGKSDAKPFHKLDTSRAVSVYKDFMKKQKQKKKKQKESDEE